MKNILLRFIFPLGVIKLGEEEDKIIEETPNRSINPIAYNSRTIVTVDYFSQLFNDSYSPQYCETASSPPEERTVLLLLSSYCLRCFVS